MGDTVGVGERERGSFEVRVQGVRQKGRWVSNPAQQRSEQRFLRTSRLVSSKESFG